MSELTHGVFDTRPEPTPSPLTREQVEIVLAQVRSYSRGTKAFSSALGQIEAHDAALRLTLAQRDDQIERLAAYILAHIPGEPSQNEGAVDTAIRVLAQQARRIAELEEQRNNFHVDAPMWRGVEPNDTCAECGGSGTKVYANTSTYHYSAGGQAMTLSVCDKCWGSGNKYRPWLSWKQQAQKIQRLEAELESHVWQISPAMAQAKIDELNNALAAMTTARDEWDGKAQALRKSNDELQATLAAREAEVAEWKQKYQEASDEKLRALDNDNLYKFVAKERDAMETQLTAAVQRAEQAEARVAGMTQQIQRLTEKVS